MRRIVLLIVAACVVLWATRGMADWRSTIKRWHGDPDEFQSSRVRDDYVKRRIVLEAVHEGEKETLRPAYRRRAADPRMENRISIRFSGNLFLLEK